MGSLGLVFDLFLIIDNFVPHQQLRLFESFLLYQLKVQLRRQPFIKFYKVYVYSQLFRCEIVVPSRLDLVVVLGY